MSRGAVVAVGLRGEKVNHVNPLFVEETVLSSHGTRPYREPESIKTSVSLVV